MLTDPAGVRARIGLSGQYAAVDEHLTGYENLEMVGRLYHLGQGASPRARARAARALRPRRGGRPAGRRPTPAACGAGSTWPAPWSPQPPVLFLDEPTTGLDPRSRQQMWDVIRELVAGGTTLLLTTQYLEEADRLADDIVVIDHGRVIAAGHRRRAQGRRSAVSGSRSSSPTSSDREAAVRVLRRGGARRDVRSSDDGRVARLPRRRRRSRLCCTRCGASTRAASPCSTSACAARPSTTCS